MKILKILAWIAAALVGLLLLALVVLGLVFDPNKYKGEIVEAVKAATGRELAISGKISWSLYPWLGVKTEGLTLGNARGFGPEPFAKIGSAGVSVELLPLLIGRVNVDSVQVRDLELHLARDAAGRNNWSDMQSGAKAPQAKRAPDKSPDKAPAKAVEKTGEHPKHGGGLPATVAIGGVNIEHADIKYRDAAAGSRYELGNLDIHIGRIAGEAPIPLQLATTLSYDQPVKQAKFTLRALLTVSDNALALRQLDATLDDSRLTGNVEIADLGKSALRFDLALDRFDLDKYSPPASAKSKTAKPPAAPAAAAAGSSNSGNPTGALRTLDARGKIAIGSIKAFGIRATELHLQLSAANGLVQVGPHGAKLYGGNFAGNASVDARGKTPQWKFDEQLTNVKLGPLLKDADVFDRFSGDADVKLALAAQGNDADAMKRSLNGSVSVAVREGKIEGVNLAKLISQARQLVDRARGKDVSVKTSATDETAFKSLSASAAVANGNARTDDLKLDGPVLRATGAGSADLVREKLDYRLKVTVAEGDDHAGNTLPVRIGGSFAEPSYNVELGEVAKEKIEKSLKKKLRDKLNR